MIHKPQKNLTRDRVLYPHPNIEQNKTIYFYRELLFLMIQDHWVSVHVDTLIGIVSISELIIKIIKIT